MQPVKIILAKPMIAAISLFLATGLNAAHGQETEKIDLVRDAFEAAGYSVVPFSDDIVFGSKPGSRIAGGVGGNDEDVSFMVYTDLTQSTFSFERLNTFNSTVKFGRVYFGTGGEAVIQLDRNTTGGVTMENLKSDIQVMALLQRKLEQDAAAAD
ncbi:MAG: YbjN domain-containing protein [Pseudomonadota bacterium]